MHWPKESERADALCLGLNSPGEETVMNGFAIFLTVVTLPGKRPEFLQLVEVNRERSLADEPGCRSYDILEKPGVEDTVCMFEVYESAEAFEEHRATPHFEVCSAGIAPLVASRTLERFTVL
jgi:(4S)-4-hydroxy-5-phosphonooxypentane-2,3-dione isomerase